MSKKFEQLLDLVVNENMDKANELFHEIVVEMSREIYENMINDDSSEDDVGESYGDDMDMEDMEEETTMEIGGDKSDDFIDDIEDHDAMDDEDGLDGEDDEFGDDEFGGDEFGGDDDMSGGEGDTEDRITDLEDALEELKAEFESLMAGEKNEPEHKDMFGGEGEEDEFGDEEEDEFGDEEEDEEDQEESYRMESRRMTREYREEVKTGHGADKKSASEVSGTNTTSPVSKASDRPSSTATAKNIAQAGKGADPKPGVGGVLKKGGEFVKAGTQNVGSTKAKGYSDKVAKPAGEKNVNDKSVIGD